jgi:hypothetical protein
MTGFQFIIELYDREPFAVKIAAVIVIYMILKGMINLPFLKKIPWISIPSANRSKRQYTSREKIHVHNMVLIPAIKMKIIQLFWEAYEISMTNAARIKELDKDLVSESCEIKAKANFEIARMPFTTLREQANIADAYQDNIEEEINTHFFELMVSNRNGKRDGILNSLEYKAFLAVNKAALQAAKSRVRALFKENHFSEMSKAEAQLKYEERANEIIHVVEQVHNDMWPGG